MGRERIFSSDAERQRAWRERQRGGDVITSLTRAAIALSDHIFDGRRNVGELLKARAWGEDRTASLLTRAAVTPAALSQAGWAAELGQVSKAFLQLLTPMSAAAQLLDMCQTLSFAGAAKISLPNITPGNATWVAEGAPIRVLTLPTLIGQLVFPSKLAAIIELTREMMDSSNIEAIVRQALIDSTAASLDSYLFDATAAVPGLRPAGLLVGVTPIAPSVSPSKAEAMDDDVSALVAAIAPVAGNGAVALVASPAQATRLIMRAVDTPGPVLMSAALPAGSVIAVATNSLVCALEPTQIDTAKSAVLHREDTSPQAPPASPLASLFQTDCVALRLRLPVTWALRDSRAVASVTGAHW